MAMSETWDVIERETREQVRADLHAADAQPVAHGQVMAWVECRFARTDSLSVVHRVGEPLEGQGVTLCGEVIPDVIRRLALTPGLIRSLGRCQWCEQAYLKSGRAA